MPGGPIGVLDAFRDRLELALADVTQGQTVRMSDVVDEFTGGNPAGQRELLMAFVTSLAIEVNDCSWIPGYAEALATASRIAIAAHQQALDTIEMASDVYTLTTGTPPDDDMTIGDLLGPYLDEGGEDVA